ncbi:unnamed protein product [Camellia sinensis]
MSWTALTSGSSEGASTMVAYPRVLSWIVAPVYGIAFLLIFTSLLLVTQPIGSTVRWNLYGVDNLREFNSTSWSNKTIRDSFNDGNNKYLRKFDVVVLGLNETESNSRHNDDGIDDSSSIKSDLSMSGDNQSVVGSIGGMDENQTSKSDDTNDVSNLQGYSGPSIVSETEKSMDQQGQEAKENPTSSNVATCFPGLSKQFQYYTARIGCAIFISCIR